MIVSNLNPIEVEFIDEMVFVNGIPRMLGEYISHQTVDHTTMGPITFMIILEPDKPRKAKPTPWQYIKELIKEAF